MTNSAELKNYYNVSYGKMVGGIYMEAVHAKVLFLPYKHILDKSFIIFQALVKETYKMYGLGHVEVAFEDDDFIDYHNISDDADRDNILRSIDMCLSLSIKIAITACLGEFTKGVK